jgi:hypothetical protein
MNKKIVFGAIIDVTLLIAVSGWLIYGQLSILQTQITDLAAQNSDSQSQLNDLQEQLRGLKLTNRELQDRLNDFTSELAKQRHLKIAITDFMWERGFHPIVGVTLIHPYNVTIQNDDAVPAFGLTLTATLIRGGIKIGDEGVMRINRLNVGATEVSAYGPLTPVGTNLDGAECIVTLSVGGIILDEWTGNIG